MSYTKTVVLPVPPDEAFALITEPERLRRWQAVTATVDLRAGGDYRWTITPGHIAAGTVTEVEPGRRVVLGWGWEGSTELPPDASTVTLTVEPTEGGTRVTLEHADLTAEQAVHHEQGWEHYFERLQRLAATGDAGPDDWAWAPDPLDPQVAAEAVLAAIQPVLRGLTVEDRTRPTPCADFTCHDLVEHLAGSMAGLGSMAGASIADPGGAPEPRVSAMAGEAVRAWRGVDVESTVPGPGGHELPASYAAAILPLELLLHGWDLAQAAGLELARLRPGRRLRARARRDRRPLRPPERRFRRRGRRGARRRTRWTGSRPSPAAVRS